MLHCVYLALEKAYSMDRWTEVYEDVQDMNEDTETVVGCAVRGTDRFNVVTGLHLTPFLFPVVKDEFRQDSHGQWCFQITL